MRVQISIDNPEIVKQLIKLSEENQLDPATICKDRIYSSFGYSNTITNIQKLEKQVFDDVRLFAEQHPGEFFTLAEASPTFKDVPTNIGSNVSALKAVIGKKFNSLVEKPEGFPNIKKVYTKDGKPRLNRVTKAQVYIVY